MRQFRVNCFCQAQHGEIVLEDSGVNVKLDYRIKTGDTKCV